MPVTTPVETQDEDMSNICNEDAAPNNTASSNTSNGKNNVDEPLWDDPKDWSKDSNVDAPLLPDAPNNTASSNTSNGKNTIYTHINTASSNTSNEDEPLWDAPKNSNVDGIFWAPPAREGPPVIPFRWDAFNRIYEGKTNREIIKDIKARLWCSIDRFRGFLHKEGMIDSVPNINRHKPLAYDMFDDVGIEAISWWVREFKKDLHPWGGQYRFLAHANWFDGPTNSKDSKYVGSCIKCKWSTWPFVYEFPGKKIPDVYFQYIEAYVADLKQIYSMNLWPCDGLDEWAPNKIRQHPMTIEERLEREKRILRPWGGRFALTWPKIGEKPELKIWMPFRAINEPPEKHALDETQFIPDSSPWYQEYLEERFEIIKRHHYYDYE